MELAGADFAPKHRNLAALRARQCPVDHRVCADAVVLGRLNLLLASGPVAIYGLIARRQIAFCTVRTSSSRGATVIGLVAPEASCCFGSMSRCDETEIPSRIG